MEYFLELCSVENEGQFIVHHKKLIEFGVATSSQSNHIKSRLTTLGLTEGAEYLLTGIREQVPSGTKHTKVYFLTPESFKLCLVRAKKGKDHSIDVHRYAKYFLFDEKVIYYYSQYESSYKEALLRNKDGVINSLRDEIQEIKTINIDQSAEIKQLLDLAYDTNPTVHALNRSHIRKSRLCTVVLANKNLEHYYGSTMMLLRDENDRPYVRIQNVRAQRKKVVATMSKYIEGDYTTNRNLPVRANHAIAIPPIYFPNATVLINRVVERFTKIVRKQKIKDFSDTFKAEIKVRTKAKLTISGFPVKMSSQLVGRGATSDGDDIADVVRDLLDLLTFVSSSTNSSFIFRLHSSWTRGNASKGFRRVPPSRETGVTVLVGDRAVGADFTAVVRLVTSVV